MFLGCGISSILGTGTKLKQLINVPCTKVLIHKQTNNKIISLLPTLLGGPQMLYPVGPEVNILTAEQGGHF